MWFKREQKVALLWGARVEKGPQWHPQSQLGVEEALAVVLEERRMGQEDGCRLCQCQQQSSLMQIWVTYTGGNKDSSMSVPSDCVGLIKEDLLLSKPSIQNCSRWIWFFFPGINSAQTKHFVNVVFSILSHRHFFQISTEGTWAKRMPYGLLRDVFQLKDCLALKDRCLLGKAGASLGMKKLKTPNYCNFCNFKIKGLSGTVVSHLG